MYIYFIVYILYIYIFYYCQTINRTIVVTFVAHIALRSNNHMN